MNFGRCLCLVPMKSLREERGVSNHIDITKGYVGYINKWKTSFLFYDLYLFSAVCYHGWLFEAGLLADATGNS